jgi:hypothetical protein
MFIPLIYRICFFSLHSNPVSFRIRPKKSISNIMASRNMCSVGLSWSSTNIIQGRPICAPLPSVYLSMAQHPLWILAAFSVS